MGGGALFLGLFLLGRSLAVFFLFGLELLFAALVSFVGLRPLGLRLASQRLPVSLVCLQLVDVFRENLLVFEHVTSSLSGTGCDTCGSQYSSIHSVF